MGLMYFKGSTAANGFFMRLNTLTQLKSLKHVFVQEEIKPALSVLLLKGGHSNIFQGGILLLSHSDNIILITRENLRGKSYHNFCQAQPKLQLQLSLGLS